MREATASSIQHGLTPLGLSFFQVRAGHQDLLTDVNMASMAAGGLAIATASQREEDADADADDDDYDDDENDVRYVTMWKARVFPFSSCGREKHLLSS